MEDTILEMKNITKTFPGVKALNNVSFRVKRHEIHCLVGENGAGKSTLMKVLSGVYPYGTYSGEIILNGKPQIFNNIKESERAGIGIIYQEFALVPEMTVYENIFLGHELRKGFDLDLNETIKETNVMLEKVRLSLNPDTKIKDLGVGKQQLIEIAKALSREVKLLILDEPTAALNEDDSENLFNLLRELKKEGVTCVLISHKLRDINGLADTVTVLRDGETVCTLDSPEGNRVTESVLIKHMIGRELENSFPAREHKVFEETVLEVKDWGVYSPKLGRQILNKVNLKVKKGEIVGLAGLMGSGRTEFARSIFGNPDEFRIKGQLFLNGVDRHLVNPKEAIEAGLAYATEDRKGNGLVLIQDVKQNITLANLKELADKWGVINTNAEIRITEGYVESLNIKTPSIEQQLINLSGGNQQKVSVAKWLFVKPKLLILDEPTRGIDVGAKYEIYFIMNKLVEQGMSIIMISSELPEILGMCDRIYVVSTGTIVGELPIAQATQEKIMRMAIS